MPQADEYQRISSFVQAVQSLVAPIQIRQGEHATEIAAIRVQLDDIRADVARVEALVKARAPEALIWGLPASHVARTVTVLGVALVIVLGLLIYAGRGGETASVIKELRGQQHGPQIPAPTP